MNDEDYWFVHMYPPKMFRYKIVAKNWKGIVALIAFFAVFFGLLFVATGLIIKGAYEQSYMVYALAAASFIFGMWLMFKKTDPDPSHSRYVERPDNA